MQVETWTTPDKPYTLNVAVTLDDGHRHHRALNSLNEIDWDDWQVAAGFWQHSAIVAGIPTNRNFSADHRELAVLTDQCLAVERIFPALRERLPA